jgi:acyl-CoA reductase-like NAD-dependent aldehyde dehydrogenase
VFNLVQGDGEGVGAPLTAHPDVDMVSFTGSTRAGKLVMKTAADTVKKVALELGGKSANILLDDADFPRAVKQGVLTLMLNSGQNCNAPSRLLVPESRLDEVEAIAAATLGKLVVGDPQDDTTTLGPVANGAQFARVQQMIESGIAEGAKLVAGGPGRPEGIARGYFVRPTIFSRVTPAMTIAREEIFGPVLSIIAYKDEDDAVRIANDTPYGLSSYLWTNNTGRAIRLAKAIESGMTFVNSQNVRDLRQPFGGSKASGTGREGNHYSYEVFCEAKNIAVSYGDHHIPRWGV